MYWGNGYTNGYEDEEERENYLKEKAAFMWPKLSIMFWVVIGGIIFAVISIALELIAAVYTVIKTGASEPGEGFLALTIAIGLVGVVLNIVYGIALIMMKKYDERYRTAGICYIISEVLDFIYQDIIGENGIGLLIGLAGIIVSVVSMFCFYNAIQDDISSFNGHLAESWNSLKKMTIALFIVMGVGMIVILISLVGLGEFILFIAVIMGIIVGIWQIVLLYKSFNAMKNYIQIKK